MKRSSDWLKSLSITKKVILGTVAFFVLVGIVGSQQPTTNLNSTNAANKSNVQQTQKHAAPTVNTKTVTETQSIPFTSTTVDDATLAKGTTKVTTTGANGSETLTYKITYTNGQQADKKLINTTVDQQPIAQVTSVGTYVAPALSCPNGTYVNSAGNTVCSPYSSPSAPAGATAQCVDGTYSFSQSRSGTCSHHGGVAQWL